VLAAGLFDGINPCAFSALLVFVGALLTYMDSRLNTTDDTGKVRRAILGVGLAYALGIFAVYFLASLGLFGVGRVVPPAAVPWVIRGSGVVVLLMGLVMIREFFVPDTALHLSMPSSLYLLARRYAHATTAGAAFVGGGLIGLCSVPCSGAVHLGVVSLLVVYGWFKGLGLLLLYNLAFMAPVLVLLAVITSRTALNRFAHWYLGYRRSTKLALGFFVVLLEFLVILRA
jgi:cytochrome c-type biogenesis protein